MSSNFWPRFMQPVMRPPAASTSPDTLMQSLKQLAQATVAKHFPSSQPEQGFIDSPSAQNLSIFFDNVEAVQASMNLRILTQFLFVDGEHLNHLKEVGAIRTSRPGLATPTSENREKEVMHAIFGNRLSVCGKSWGRGEWAIRCRTCAPDPSSVVCPECFNEQDHLEHDWWIIRTSGGCCDCGDPESWNKAGFCKSHSGPVPNPHAEVCPLQLEIFVTCAKALGIAVSHMIHRAQRSHRPVCLAPVLRWVLQYLTCNNGARRLAAFVLLQPGESDICKPFHPDTDLHSDSSPVDQSFASTIRNVPFPCDLGMNANSTIRMNEQPLCLGGQLYLQCALAGLFSMNTQQLRTVWSSEVIELCTTLLTDVLFKTSLADALGCFYTCMSPSFNASDSSDPMGSRHAHVLLSELSVQVLTVGTLSERVFVLHKLHIRIFKEILSKVKATLSPQGLVNPSAKFFSDETAGIWRPLTDMRYLLSHGCVAEMLLGDEESARWLAEFLCYLGATHHTHRVIGQHIEFENTTWMDAANADLVVAESIVEPLLSAAESLMTKSSENPDEGLSKLLPTFKQLAIYMQAWVDIVFEYNCRRLGLATDSPFHSSFSLGDQWSSARSDHPDGGVCMRMPIIKLFGKLLAVAGRHGHPIQRTINLLGWAQLQPCFYEPVLRVLATMAEARSGMWVRNGAEMVSCVAAEVNPAYFRDGVMTVFWLAQICLTCLGGDTFWRMLLCRSGLNLVLTDSSSEAWDEALLKAMEKPANVAPFSDKWYQMLREMLRLAYALHFERGSSTGAPSPLQRAVIATVAGMGESGGSFSSIRSHLPRSAGETQQQIEATLRDFCTFEQNPNLGPGTYKLTAEGWACWEPHLSAALVSGTTLANALQGLSAAVAKHGPAARSEQVKPPLPTLPGVDLSQAISHPVVVTICQIVVAAALRPPPPPPFPMFDKLKAQAAARTAAQTAARVVRAAVGTIRENFHNTGGQGYSEGGVFQTALGSVPGNTAAAVCFSRRAWNPASSSESNALRFVFEEQFGVTDLEALVNTKELSIVHVLLRETTAVAQSIMPAAEAFSCLQSTAVDESLHSPSRKKRLAAAKLRQQKKMNEMKLLQSKFKASMEFEQLNDEDEVCLSRAHSSGASCSAAAKPRLSGNASLHEVCDDRTPCSVCGEPLQVSTVQYDPESRPSFGYFGAVVTGGFGAALAPQPDMAPLPDLNVGDNDSGRRGDSNEASNHVAAGVGGAVITCNHLLHEACWKKHTSSMAQGVLLDMLENIQPDLRAQVLTLMGLIRCSVCRRKATNLVPVHKSSILFKPSLSVPMSTSSVCPLLHFEGPSRPFSSTTRRPAIFMPEMNLVLAQTIFDEAGDQDINHNISIQDLAAKFLDKSSHVKLPTRESRVCSTVMSAAYSLCSLVQSFELLHRYDCESNFQRKPHRAMESDPSSAADLSGFPTNVCGTSNGSMWTPFAQATMGKSLYGEAGTIRAIQRALCSSTELIATAFGEKWGRPLRDGNCYTLVQGNPNIMHDSAQGQNLLGEQSSQRGISEDIQNTFRQCWTWTNGWHAKANNACGPLIEAVLMLLLARPEELVEGRESHSCDWQDCIQSARAEVVRLSVDAVATELQLRMRSSPSSTSRQVSPGSSRHIFSAEEAQARLCTHLRHLWLVFSALGCCKDNGRHSSDSLEAGDDSMTHINFPTTACKDELKWLCTQLGLPNAGKLLDDEFWSCTERNAMATSEQRIFPSGMQVCGMSQQPMQHLISVPCLPSAVRVAELPITFAEVFWKHGLWTCQICKIRPRTVCVCLICGERTGSRESCCGLSPMKHTARYHGGSCAFLVVSGTAATATAIVEGNRTRLWNSLYVDVHGEEDIGMSRGRPLRLSSFRRAKLVQSLLGFSVWDDIQGDQRNRSVNFELD